MKHFPRVLKRYRHIGEAVLSVLCVAIVFTLCLFYIRIEREKYELIALAAALAVCVLLFLVFPLFEGRRTKIVCAVLALALALSCAFFAATPAITRNITDTTYDAPQVERQMFADKKVLIFVPHEDDEINVTGGVLEQYVQAGSEVKLVFTTQGDYYGIADTRVQEALACAEFYGLDEDDVIFLGYGDEWDTVYGHIYNAPDDEIITSHNGKTATYAAGGVEPYRYADYTRANYLADMESIILSYLPDVIFCVDYDHHPDHRAVSLFFEEAMGNILSTVDGYTPDVFKGFAYTLAWEAKSDFYQTNLGMTVQYTDRPGDEKPMEETGQYIWKDRVRFPVATETLATTVYGSSTYQALACHASQGATGMAEKVINSDKVFFRRETSSLCYKADISVSSNEEDGYKLNDFKISDSDSISVEWNNLPVDGAWIPDADDGEKEITVRFASPVEISVIRLYDSISLEDNITNCLITFDDGDSIETGALAYSGSATTITFETKTVSSFTVKITGTSGDNCGITEIEAFESMPDDTDNAFIKIMDETGNFAYDYVLEESEQAFSLYGYFASTDLSDYEITADNLTTEVRDGKLYVSVAKGENGVLTVTSKSDPSLSDSVRFRNLSVSEKGQRAFLQNMIHLWNFSSFADDFTGLISYVTEKI